MMKKLNMGLCGLCLSIGLVAQPALSKEGVKNPVVKARMELMGGIAQNMKILGDTLKGKMDFDAQAVADALANIETLSKEIPAKFEANEDDPKSEAKPEIWTNMDDFVAKSQSLHVAAQAMKGAVKSQEDLPMVMQKVGGACKACHSLYKD